MTSLIAEALIWKLDDIRACVGPTPSASEALEGASEAGWSVGVRCGVCPLRR